MQITRTSQLSDITRTMEIPVTQENLNSYYKEGKLLQDSFPGLTASQLEFIKTGITEEEWDNLFRSAEEYENMDDYDEEDLMDMEHIDGATD